MHTLHWRGRHTIAFIYRYDHVNRKHHTAYKKLLELISELSKVQGYKVKTHKSIVFLYISNELQVELQKYDLQ